MGAQRVRPDRGVRPQVLAAHKLLLSIGIKFAHRQIKGAGGVETHSSIISGARQSWTSPSS